MVTNLIGVPLHKVEDDILEEVKDVNCYIQVRIISFWKDGALSKIQSMATLQ